MAAMGIEVEAVRMATELFRAAQLEAARIRGTHEGAVLIRDWWGKLEVGLRAFAVGLREAVRMELREAR